jgi:hypothetical protein
MSTVELENRELWILMENRELWILMAAVKTIVDSLTIITKPSEEHELMKLHDNLAKAVVK